jgi:Papain family cysteine protease.
MSLLQSWKNAITEHINDEGLTLPEKSALMAQILLKDEDMLSGYLYNKNQPAFLDLFREPVNYFIEHYNSSVEFEKDEDGNVIKDEETGIPVIKDQIPPGPQNEEGYIYAPFDLLKKLRMDIQQCSEFIRQRSEELQQLEESQKAMKNADNVVVEDDDYFKRFKLIGDDIKEDPLQENYEPTPTKETNIDLSHDFTPIKNQGPVGACTTFAVTAVYEHILKKNDRADHDLSERFLYYNSRETDGRLDKEGVAISTAIRSIGEKGICIEEKWPYSFDEYNVKPNRRGLSRRRVQGKQRNP